eukprot:3549739-Prymnesium_polylepis.1
MVLATIPRPPSRFPRLQPHAEQPNPPARRAETSTHRSAIQRTQRNATEPLTKRPPARSASTSR